jgi:hypothetical protein
MDELFSCRNCIHNCGQSLTIGSGAGYCLQHDSVISEPQRTTCKYLHRKDLAVFVVDQGVREHAAEYALFPRLATLDTKEAIERIHYSEKYLWESGTFDPLTHALAQYFKSSRRWIFIQAFTAGVDGRRSLAHSSLVRHYMEHCGTWTSSYRLVLGLLEEIDNTPAFSPQALAYDGQSPGEEETDALWDVVYTRFAALQEYGWHAGLESLMWATDAVNGSLADLNWQQLQGELSQLRKQWIELVIAHAKQHDAFFPQREYSEEEHEAEEVSERA